MYGTFDVVHPVNQPEMGEFESIPNWSFISGFTTVSSSSHVCTFTYFHHSPDNLRNMVFSPPKAGFDLDMLDIDCQTMCISPTWNGDTNQSNKGITQIDTAYVEPMMITVQKNNCPRDCRFLSFWASSIQFSVYQKWRELSDFVLCLFWSSFLPL